METLKDKNLRMLKDGNFYDVTFIVREERIKAHRNFLASSSSVFRSMFTESEEPNEFTIQDIPPKIFYALLEFIYTGELPEFNKDYWNFLIYVSYKYEIYSLEKSIEFNSIMEEHKGTSSQEVTFVVEQERVKVHKHILPKIQSCFDGYLVEVIKDEFEVKELSLRPFKKLVEYLYNSKYPILKEDNWASILCNAKMYKIDALMKKCIEFVDNNCTRDNACRYFNQAKKYQVDSLVPQVKRTIAMNTDLSLLDIEDEESLNEILSCNLLNCDEIFVFQSALKWASSQIKKRGEEESGDNLRKVLGEAIYSIRFPTIRGNELKEEIIPKDILTNKEIICSFKINQDSNPFNRGSRIRSCHRFDNYDSAPLIFKRHSIQFQVDCKVEIDSFGIYYPSNKKEQRPLSGRIILKNEGNAILRERDFEVDFRLGYIIPIICFRNPIIIHPNNLYTAEIEYDDAMNVETWIGKGGKSKVVIDGVKWEFNNDPKSCEQTDVDKGQIPMIFYTKLN